MQRVHPTAHRSTGPSSVRSSVRRRRLSAVLHRLGAASASAAAAPIAAAVSLAFLLGASVGRRTTAWLTAFEALAAAVTLVMVFVLQHTQSRQQAALQRKLDEVLRVLPGTDPRMLHLETGTEEELDAADERHTALRGAALTEGR